MKVHSSKYHRLDRRGKTSYLKKCKKDYGIEQYVESLSGLPKPEAEALIAAKERSIRFLFNEVGAARCELCCDKKICRFYKILKKGGNK